MKYIRVGKIVNTHGIKGEVRILSDFRHKDKVFVKGMKLYIGKKKKELEINSYRFHKIFDMVTFVGINNINDVLEYKGEFVFINEEDLVLDEGEFFSEKLIGFKMMIGEKDAGEIIEVIDTPANEVLKTTKALVPYVKSFIKDIDEDKKIIYINDIGGLINED